MAAKHHPIILGIPWLLERDAAKKWVNETEKTTKIIILKFAYFNI